MYYNRITSIESLLANISTVQPRLFRGQANAEWLLQPQISRVKLNDVYGNQFTCWSDLEKFITQSFKIHGLQYLNREPKDTLEWLIHAQHHGAPTRLLDWSSSPLKALYFCVENTHLDDEDGSFYSYLPFNEISSDQVDLTASELQVFYPIEINSRITAQDGCFSLFPLPRGYNTFFEIEEFNRSKKTLLTLDDYGVVEKFIVPKDDKEKIRIQLDCLGVNDKSMFPDLDGVSKHIKRKLKIL